jgi:hypothetical protein
MKEEKKVIGANVAKSIATEIDRLVIMEFRNFSHAVEVLLEEALKARGITVIHKAKEDAGQS